MKHLFFLLATALLISCDKGDADPDPVVIHDTVYVNIRDTIFINCDRSDSSYISYVWNNIAYKIKPATTNIDGNIEFVGPLNNDYHLWIRAVHDKIDTNHSTSNGLKAYAEGLSQISGNHPSSFLYISEYRSDTINGVFQVKFYGDFPSVTNGRIHNMPFR